MKRLIPWSMAVLASCLLSACAVGPQPMPALPVPPPPNLTRPPQPLPPPSSGRMKDLEQNHLQVTRAYHQLAAQMCGLLVELEVKHDECTPWLQLEQQERR